MPDCVASPTSASRKALLCYVHTLLYRGTPLIGTLLTSLRLRRTSSKLPPGFKTFRTDRFLQPTAFTSTQDRFLGASEGPACDCACTRSVLSWPESQFWFETPAFEIKPKRYFTALDPQGGETDVAQQTHSKPTLLSLSLGRVLPAPTLW